MPKAENTHALSIANRRLKAPQQRIPTRYPLCPRYDIETVYGLVKTFGGFEATAAEYGIATEQVEKWAVGGFIQPGWHLRMFGRVCAMGKTIAPSVWGFSENDEAGQALARLMYDARLQREGDAHV
jgi:hypothetical protein